MTVYQTDCIILVVNYFFLIHIFLVGYRNGLYISLEDLIRINVWADQQRKV